MRVAIDYSRVYNTIFFESFVDLERLSVFHVICQKTATAEMSKKDMRREDLSTCHPASQYVKAHTNPTSVIPYTEPPKSKDDADFQGTLASTLPMAAVCPSNPSACKPGASRPSPKSHVASRLS